MTISRKLTLLFTLTAGVSLVAFAAALWAYQSDAYRRQLRQEMVTLSGTVADSSSAALAFGDKLAASEALAGLEAEPRVSSACLYRSNNMRMSSVSRGGAPAPCPTKPGEDRLEFSRAGLTVVRTVRLKGEVVGRLWLLVDLADFYQQLRQLGFICVAALLFSLLLAGTVAARLQRLISGPLLDLAEVAGKVSLKRDYSIRAVQTSTDELGVLVARFNEMMRQIHQRDIALERAHASLEEKVAGRTAELREEIGRRHLAEQQLLGAKEAAEESSRAKSAFLATVSHELRTPLNAIVLYGGLLEEDAIAQGNQSAVADLGAIKSAGQHLLSLINEILDFSKIEAGFMELHSEPLTVSDLLMDVATQIQPLARKNRNVFEVPSRPEPWVVDVDPARFRQSLLNLLANACKFTEDGKVALTVSREIADRENWICFNVSDTGPGIAAADMHKLFKPFSQVDSSTTRKHGGTGLGLSISRRYCELMGGTITVSSVPGQGSTFTMRLPELAAASTGLPDP
jgi:signal transduction histidine kinase